MLSSCVGDDRSSNTKWHSRPETTPNTLTRWTQRSTKKSYPLPDAFSHGFSSVVSWWSGPVFGPSGSTRAGYFPVRTFGAATQLAAPVRDPPSVRALGRCSAGPGPARPPWFDATLASACVSSSHTSSIVADVTYEQRRFRLPGVPRPSALSLRRVIVEQSDTQRAFTPLPPESQLNAPDFARSQ